MTTNKIVKHNAELDSFDTPDLDVVYQKDIESDIIPVQIKGIVPTNEMPCDANGFHRILRANSGSERILPEHKQRKLIVIQDLTSTITGITGQRFILIAPTKSACDGMNGILLQNGQATVRYEYPWQSELWARGVTMNSASGLITGFVASNQDALLSVATFDWAL